MKIMRDNLSAEPMPEVSGSAHGGEQTTPGHVGVSGVAVVGKRMDGDAAAGRELAQHLYIAGIHERNQVFHDYIDTVFVKVTVVSEAEKIKLQTFALDHFLRRDIADDDARKVGLTGLGAKGGELGTEQSHKIIFFGMFVIEGLEQRRVVVGGIFCARGSEELKTVKFVLVSHWSVLEGGY